MKNNKQYKKLIQQIKDQIEIKQLTLEVINLIDEYSDLERQSLIQENKDELTHLLEQKERLEEVFEQRRGFKAIKTVKPLQRILSIFKKKRI